MPKIAVDFDGTIVENAFPQIGKPKPFAFETLHLLEKQGFTLVLWTCRTGKFLEEAITFCKKNGIDFYAVNSNYPEEVFREGDSRKIEADYYVDDRVIGGFPGWGEIYQTITGTPDEMFQTKKGLFSRLLGA
jgi:hydroxymethylpyrimidine pyrophosphatase-like HAD family hydrolase